MTQIIISDFSKGNSTLQRINILQNQKLIEAYYLSKKE